MSTTAARLPISQSTFRTLSGLGIASAAAFGLGAVISPQQVWPNLLTASFYLLGLGLAGVLFLALTRITGGRWHNELRPIPEAMGRALPMVAPLFGAVILFGVMYYPWMHHDGHHSASFWFKEWWLTSTFVGESFPSFFAVRTIAYLVLLSLLARPVMSRSHHTAGTGSASFLVAFAIVFSLAGVDWVMSLEPMWFSTMFGVYQFSGIFLSGLAAITVIATLLSRAGVWRGQLTENQLRDLGILTFSFSCFWMYIWYCQYMLIWYANIPEETFYYVDRIRGAWHPLFLANVVLNWVVPFAVLISRPAKRNANVMFKVAIVILLGRWLDIYLMVVPSRETAQPEIGFCEIGSFLAVIALFGFALFYVFRRGLPQT